MWAQASPALLLLLACCLRSAETQRRQSIWEDPIKFKTKGGDMCTMVVTGQGDYTRLRLSCQGSRRSYWCEYLGTPKICSNFNKNPRHYFLQMMWGLRKLHNACQGPRQVKPHMCKKASNDSQMVFSSASFSQLYPEGPAARDQPRQPARVPTRPRTTQKTKPQPTTPPVETTAKRMARQYCWRSLQGMCSFFIGLFRKN